MYMHTKYFLVGALGALALICGWNTGCEPAGGDDDDDITTDDDDITADDDVADDDDDSTCPTSVDFEEIAQGESYGDGTGLDTDCNEITVVMVESQTELENAYQSYLPNVETIYIPVDVDFDSALVLFSYAAGCGGAGFNLIMNAVCLDGTNLKLHETLVYPDGWLGMPARVFNVTKVPIGDYDSMDLILTEEYTELE